MENPAYEKLKELRTRKDLTIRPTPHLRDTYIALDGVEKPFSLRYYQIQGMLHLLTMPRFVLGDDCGIGKTPTTIVALCFLWEKNPSMKAIILTNKSAVEQWASEFMKFTKGIRVLTCKGTPKQREVIRKKYEASTDPTVLIMGYRSAVGDFTHIQEWKDYSIVFDECSAFKNNSTQVHKVCHYLTSKSSRAWGLSATIIKNTLIEGWGIYRVIVPGLFGTKEGFLNDFCVIRMQQIPGSRRQIPIIVGYRPRDIQRFRETIDPFFLGRAKFEVASELPPLTTSVIKVGLSPSQRAKYDEALSGLLEVVRGGKTEEKEVTKLTAVAYCQQIVDHPDLIGGEGDSEKLDALMDLLVDGQFDGEKVIIFTKFRKMVDILMRTLEEKKIGAVRITGSENEKQRKDAQDAFQDVKSDTKVICITTAATEAINLQAAKAIIFYDTPWSAGDFLQALGRMIRIGSLHDRCFAVHLVADDTIDDRVMKVLEKKMVLVESVLGKKIKGEGDTITVSAENDISDLFAQLLHDAKVRSGGK